jgi:hypothetical protein
VSATYEVKFKQLDKLFCDKVDCVNPATKKIIFHLGSSAGFCSGYDEGLIKNGLGFEHTESNKKDKVLESVGKPELTPSRRYSRHLRRFSI